MAVRSYEERWWTISGLVAVGVAAAPMVLIMYQNPAILMSPIVVRWWVYVGAFVAAFLVAARGRCGRGVLIVALIAQSVFALGANWLMPMANQGVALTAILLVVVAAGLSSLPKYVAIAWVLVQTAGLLVIYVLHWPFQIALLAGGAYGAMQMVVYSATSLARAEREKRIAVESTLRELLSTREMLEETVRSIERSEFARELHDVMGHHLVALGLQLDAASVAESPREHLADARKLVRLLLADVREVVADLRVSSGVDLRRSLLNLASEGPGPRVVVEVSEEAPPMPSGLAQTLLRCAQEALTNARKHARASNVRIALDSRRLAISDDGRWMSPGGGGVGIEVMRERCERAGVACRIESSPQGGTMVIVDFAQEATS